MTGWVTAASSPVRSRSRWLASYSASSANGASFSAQNRTSITMVAGSGDQLDSTSALDGPGGFSNTWQAAS